MKMERNTELAVLEGSVMPGIQEAKECLRAGKTEEMWEIIDQKLIERFLVYRESEMEKYNNSPDNLKGAPNVECMLKIAESCQSAIDLLIDEKENTRRTVDEETLSAVERIVKDIIG